MEHLLCFLSQNARALVESALELAIGVFFVWRGWHRVRSMGAGMPDLLDRHDYTVARVLFGRARADRGWARSTSEARVRDGYQLLISGSVLVLMAVTGVVIRAVQFSAW